MRATNANQRVAREIAEVTDSGYSARAREIRAENERRTNAANRRNTSDRTYVWLMNDICSTPYAGTRA